MGPKKGQRGAWLGLIFLLVIAAGVWVAATLRWQQRAADETSPTVSQWAATYSGIDLNSSMAQSWTPEIAQKAETGLSARKGDLVTFPSGQVRRVSVSAAGPILTIEVIVPWITDIVVTGQFSDSDTSKIAILKPGSTVNIIGTVTACNIETRELPKLDAEEASTYTAVLRVNVDHARFR
jgi:hypothetical protein